MPYQTNLSLNQIPNRNKDPRLFNQCRAVFGENGLSTIGVNTIEDMIAKFRQQPPPRSQSCGMLHPYGRFVETVSTSSTHNDKALYIEIPKCASTTMKTMLYLEPDPKFGQGGWHSSYDKVPPSFPVSQLSFVVVREPLARFVSGYQTVRSRLLLKHGYFHDESSTSITLTSEVNRFVSFTKRILTHGAHAQHVHDFEESGLVTVPGSGCIWYHTLSQMWFIEMYPLPINFILHLETLEADLKLLKKLLPIKMQSTSSLPKMNSKGGYKAPPGELDLNTLKKKAPATMLLILHYLRQDYACLNYSLPEDLEAIKRNVSEIALSHKEELIEEFEKDLDKGEGGG